MRQLAGVTGPSAAISPDGRSVAFIVSRPDFARNRRIRTLMLADVASATSRPLPTAGQAALDPQWSPDGRSLAVLGDGRQLLVLAMPGAEATRLTQDQYNLSEGNVGFGSSFGGSPWLDGRQEAYRAQSAITYVADVRTPTLILSSTRDSRASSTNAYRLFRALRDIGVETKFVAYPGSAHFPGDPVNQLDASSRWIGWVRNHLGGRGAVRRCQASLSNVGGVSRTGGCLLSLALPFVTSSHPTEVLLYGQRQLRLALVAILAASPVAAQQHYKLDDFRRLVGVSSPAIAPDGRSVAFIVVQRQRLLPTRTLMLTDVASGASRPLPFEEQGVWDPQWSPDGRSLAVLATAGGTRQLWVLPLQGGEATRLTHSPAGVQSYAWHPDGSAIAFVTQDTVRREPGEARPGTGFEVGNGDLFWESPPREPSHLWLVSAEGGEARRLSSGTWTVEQPDLAPLASGLSWSHDGRSIAFVRLITTETGSRDSRTVVVLDVASGALRELTGEAARQVAPRFSPDGRLIAYRHERDSDHVTRISATQGPRRPLEVHVAPAGGGAGRLLTRALDRNLWLAEWLPDGQSLLVAGNTGTTTGLWIQPLEGAARPLPLGDLVLNGTGGFDLALAPTGAIAFVARTPTRPSELYFMASPTAPPRRLTDLNAEVAGFALGRTEAITWSGPDGFTADGVVTYPPDFDPGRRYPLVLNIHGGPGLASNTAFDPVVQAMASEGWIVFQPNYRGSDNLGDRFMAAILNDAGRGPGQDVMAGVAELRKRPYVDPARTAVTGWSYGGFMTAWLIGNYPGEWQAAVAGAPVTDWEDQYNYSMQNTGVAASFGGSPWTDGRQQAYREQSPITYAANVRTPTLIMSMTRDPRVASTQAYALFRALRDNGVETRFVAYPGRGHFPAGPANMLDVYSRWIGWVRDHLGPSDVGRMPQPTSARLP